LGTSCARDRYIAERLCDFSRTLRLNSFLPSIPMS
jgi:hypothetical protein